MFAEFQSQLLTPNYAWAIGAVLVGIFLSLIFRKHIVFTMPIAYVGFIFPTIKLQDAVHTMGYDTDFNRAAHNWGISPLELASASTAGLVLLIVAVLWALNK